MSTTTYIFIENCEKHHMDTYQIELGRLVNTWKRAKIRMSMFLQVNHYSMISRFHKPEDRL